MTVEISKSNPKIGDTVDIVFKAKIPEGWHLYGSQSDCPADDGPIRAEISIDSVSGFRVIGKLTEVASHLVKDTEIWNCTTSEFKTQCEFHKTLIVTGPLSGLKAHLYAQKCSDSDGMCLMVKETLSIPIYVQ